MKDDYNYTNISVALENDKKENGREETMETPACRNKKREIAGIAGGGLSEQPKAMTKKVNDVRDAQSASAMKDKKTADADSSEEHYAKKEGIAKKLDAKPKEGADAKKAEETLPAKEAEEVRDPRSASAKKDKKTADAECSEEHVAKKDGIAKKIDAKSKEGADATNAQEILTTKETEEVRDPRIASAKKDEKTADADSSEEHVAKKDGIAKKLDAKSKEGADATNAQEILTTKETEEVRDPRIASAKKDEKTADAESSEEH
ncbi:hypothetical protein ANCCAN_22367, partial [Ancylostoma caninum]